MTDLERRMGEMHDERELMLKTEPMGRMRHFETRMEARIEELALCSLHTKCRGSVQFAGCSPFYQTSLSN